MKKLFFLAFGLFVAASAHGQAITRLDVTTYGAKKDCSADAGQDINNAINALPAGQGVLYFPTGCYLIGTQILDANSSAYITYANDGAVELRASSAPPANSIIKFGNDSATVVYRLMNHFYFNCNNQNIDGIDLDGLRTSEFDNVTISGCNGTAAMRTVGANVNDYGNIYRGGQVYGTASSSGVLLGGNYQATNAWSFYGTTIVAGGSGSSGVGLDFEGTAGGFYGGDVEGWAVGIQIASSNVNSTPGPGAIEISGSYLENNSYYGIRLGYPGYSGEKALAVTITGNYINCSNLAHTTGIDIEQASGFTITSNRIRQCTVWAIKGQPDGTYQGADNGFVAANYIDGGQGILLQGSNNTVASSLATKSSNYILSGNDSWINVTGNTTITVPHAMTAQQWNVFNSGTGNVAIVCDSGTINGETTISLASNTGKTITTDGTNCFAH